MYAVYGLNEDSTKIEVFLGYIPASFFEDFTDPQYWSIKTIGKNGHSVTGRLCGRAFFVPAHSMRADRGDIESYMDPQALPGTRRDT